MSDNSMRDESLVAPLAFSVALYGGRVADGIKLAKLIAVAARWVPLDRARELARNVVAYLQDGESTKYVRASIDRRVEHFGLEVRDGDAAGLAEAMANEWKGVTA